MYTFNRKIHEILSLKAMVYKECSGFFDLSKFRRYFKYLEYRWYKDPYTNSYILFIVCKKYDGLLQREVWNHCIEHGIFVYLEIFQIHTKFNLVHGRKVINLRNTKYTIPINIKQRVSKILVEVKDIKMEHLKEIHSILQEYRTEIYHKIKNHELTYTSEYEWILRDYTLWKNNIVKTNPNVERGKYSDKELLQLCKIMR